MPFSSHINPGTEKERYGNRETRLMLLIVLPWSRALVRVSPASKTPMLGAIRGARRDGNPRGEHTAARTR
jgi:hypothetical protein